MRKTVAVVAMALTVPRPASWAVGAPAWAAAFYQFGSPLRNVNCGMGLPGEKGACRL
jgi:hypothetical protein